MKSHNVMRPYMAACAIALVGMIMTIVAIATPEWTSTDKLTIGLWTLTTTIDGRTYYWTQTGEYLDFFYTEWFMAARALVMAGLIVGSLGILFNVYVMKKNPSNGGVVLLVYYMLAFCLLVSGAAVYCSLIPQGVNSDGNVAENDQEIVGYAYLGGYGYSLWLCWIASGVFLLASGMAFEGSNQQARAKRFKRLVEIEKN